MKTILILGVIVECIILIYLTILKKWTKKIFIVLSAITGICCLGVGVMDVMNQYSEKVVDQRAHIYMAARLIQEDYIAESLESLSTVTDESGMDFEGRSIRALAYNLNEAYETAENYLLAGNNDEDDLIILESSSKKKKVDEGTEDRITSAAINLINGSEEEIKRWEAEMKVRFMGISLSDEEEAELDSELALVKTAISEYRYEDAYNQLTSDPRNGDIKNAIIVSNMYVNNYNQRLMVDADSEYTQLWNEAVGFQVDLNMAALSYPKGDEVSDEMKQEYQKAKAKYELAMDALDKEAVKRAINYLQSIEVTNSQYELGYQLQLARLYYMDNQLDVAKKCIEYIFTTDVLDDTKWLGRDIAVYKEAYIGYISNPENDECSILFDELMSSLYESMFTNDSFGEFKEFVNSCLREIFGGLTITRIDASDFPQIVSEVSVRKKNIEMSENSLVIVDTEELVTDFLIEEVEINDLSLAFVLDCSGSMEGDRLNESKSAIKQCVSQMADNVLMSFITFENSAVAECNQTDSKHLVMNLVESVRALGGTNIASGLSTAIDTLKEGSENKVVILLSDGYDSTESQKMLASVLTEAISNNVVVYTIGLEGCDEAYLENISNKTGGQFIMVADVSELNKTYQEIQNAMMNTYIISYNVSNEDQSRFLKISEKSSFVEARRTYSSLEAPVSKHDYGIQEANYYKQIGGNNNGR